MTNSTRTGSEIDLGRPQGSRRALLAGVVALPGLALGAFIWKRHGLTARFLNPFAADRFDLPPLADLRDSAGAPIPGFSAGDIAGKTVFLHAFASWCPQCREEHPALLDFVRTSGVTVYGVASMDEPAHTLQFLRENGNPYARVGLDRKAYLYRALGARGVPASFLIDSNKVALKLEGPQSLEIFRAEVLPRLI